MAAQPKDPFTPSLTREQWAGLARLGDMIHGSEQLLGGPAGAFAMETVLRASQWNERFDLEGSIEEALATLSALREAAALRQIRENIPLMTETLQLLLPLLPQILDALRRIPLADMVAALRAVGDLVPRLNAVQAFLQGPMGDKLVAKIKEVGDLWEETATDETILEALRVLKGLQDDGNLERLAGLSRQIGLFAETIDLTALLGQLVRQGKDSALVASPAILLHSGEAMAQALAEAIEHASKEPTGGLRGLLHMLSDPDVQRGMRTVAALPIFLEKVGVLPESKPMAAKPR